MPHLEGKTKEIDIDSFNYNKGVGEPRLCWISDASITQQLELGTQPSRSMNLL